MRGVSLCVILTLPEFQDVSLCVILTFSELQPVLLSMIQPFQREIVLSRVIHQTVEMCMRDDS